MNRIPLGATGRETTRLGLGCSRLMGSIGHKESVALLEAAYDAGIRHFDVAPAYGGGLAEVCVGEVLGRHRADVTVTTKYGVPVHDKPGLKQTLRRLAMPVVEMVPGLKQRLQRAGQASAGPAGPRESLPFTPALLRASVEKSLALLKTDRIDLFLLHEVMAEDLPDDSLLRTLEDLVAAGTIGAFGCASGYERVLPLLAERTQYCPVVQHEWSVLSPMLPPGPFRLLHRSLSEHFTALHSALLADKPRAKRWSEFCEADVADAETLSHLMLKASLSVNPESVILFSSKKPKHIQTNVALVDDVAMEAQALKLYSLVRSEISSVLPGDGA